MDPLGRFGGIEALWRVFLSTTLFLPSYNEYLKDTYWYAEDMANKWRRLLPDTEAVIICISCNGKLFRAWRGGGWKLEFDGTEKSNWESEYGLV